MLGEIKSIFHIPLGWFEKVDRWLSSVHPGRMISFGSDPENPEIEVDMDTFRAEVQKIAHGGDLTHSDITDWDDATKGFAPRPTYGPAQGRVRFPVLYDFDSLTMHYMDAYHWVPTIDINAHPVKTEPSISFVSDITWDGSRFVVSHKSLSFNDGYFTGVTDGADTYIETIPYNP